MIAGLVFLAMAIGAAFLLITDVLFDGARVWIYSGRVWVMLVGLWFGRPLRRHLRGLLLRPLGDRARELLGDLALAVGGLGEHGLVDEDRGAGDQREIDRVARARVDRRAALEHGLGVEDAVGQADDPDLLQRAARRGEQVGGEAIGVRPRAVLLAQPPGERLASAEPRVARRSAGRWRSTSVAKAARSPPRAALTSSASGRAAID